jgi:hypothetical protein
VRVPRGLTTGGDVTGDLSLDCDVVIVGSGAGGATMAAELAEAGVDVVVIEEGGYHPTESFTADSMRALRTLYRDGGGGMAVGRPSVVFAEGRCVGGSTVVNGGNVLADPAAGTGTLVGGGGYWASASRRWSPGSPRPRRGTRSGCRTRRRSGGIRS